MQVQLKSSYNYTSTVISALTEATNIKVTEVWRKGKRHLFCAGYDFRTTKQLGKYLLEQINGWMLDAGIVDIERLENARYQRSFCPFEFIGE